MKNAGQPCVAAHSTVRALFGLLAVELAVSLSEQQGTTLTTVLSGVFLVIALFFIYRSFYGMRIVAEK